MTEPSVETVDRRRPEGAARQARALVRGAARALVSAEFLRYVVVGGLTFALDMGLLVLCRSVLHTPLWLATTVAYLAVLFNFAANARWVFASGSMRVTMMVKYALLAVANYFITLGVVVTLASLGLFYVVAKLVAVGLCVLLNFFVYRHWIFVR